MLNFFLTYSYVCIMLFLFLFSLYWPALSWKLMHCLCFCFVFLLLVLTFSCFCFLLFLLCLCILFNVVFVVVIFSTLKFTRVSWESKQQKTTTIRYIVCLRGECVCVCFCCRELYSMLKTLALPPRVVQVQSCCCFFSYMLVLILVSVLFCMWGSENRIFSWVRECMSVCFLLNL